MSNAISPVNEFFRLILEVWNAFPAVIQALISMVVATLVIFGILNMLKG